ncbi:DUF962 domain-containing protein [Denitratisoma sp. agr-D3]
MKTIEDHLANYAAYHRDRRNIATHFVGIPLIVAAVAILLSRPAVGIAGLTVTPAMGLAGVVGLYYLRLHPALGALMCLLLGLAVTLGQSVAALPAPLWLGIGIGAFVVGWVFQLVGHMYEGRKPAFVDDLIGLVIGPLFVVVEVLGKMGWAKALNGEIERRAGPQRQGRQAPNAALPPT